MSNIDKITVNTVLHTKDGRVIGNGIVIKVSQGLCHVKTDYGNVIKLTPTEVLEVFYIAYENLDEATRGLAKLLVENHIHYVNSPKTP